jgi:hypothetical protein
MVTVRKPAFTGRLRIDFNEIRSRVTVRDILADFGHLPTRNRMACPIHNGKNPTSFSFTDGGFCCFSCGASGGLLDLIEALTGCDRQGAMEYLAQKAGISLQRYSVGEKSDIPKSTRKKRVVILDSEIIGLQVDLKGLEVLRDHYTWRIRDARKRLYERSLDLSGYYSETQYCDYVLEGLDAEVSMINHEINMKRGQLNAGRH